MIRIFKTKDAWHLIDEHLSLDPFVYDDIKYLLEDLYFIMEAYNEKNENSQEK